MNSLILKAKRAVIFGKNLFLRSAATLPRASVHGRQFVKYGFGVRGLNGGLGALELKETRFLR